MKKIYFIMLFASLISFECRKKNSESIQNKVILESIPKRSISNKDFLEILSSYIKRVKCKNTVFGIFLLNQGYDSTTYMVYHIDYLDLLYSFYPDSFFILDNEIFFIYNGTDKLTANSNNLYDVTKILESKKLKKSFKIGSECDIPEILIKINNKTHEAKRCKPPKCYDNPIGPLCEETKQH